MRTERPVRLAWVQHMTVCVEGHAAPFGEPEPRVQIQCPRGHWTWEDGDYCAECGVRLDDPVG